MFFIKWQCKIDLILLHTSCHYLRCELHNCRNLILFFISDLAETRQRSVTHQSQSHCHTALSVSLLTVMMTVMMTVLRGVS